MWRRLSISILTLALIGGVTHAGSTSAGSKPAGLKPADSKPVETIASRSVTGELRQIVSDDFESGTPKLRTILHLANGDDLVLHGDGFAQAAGGRVTVTGTSLDDRNFAVQHLEQLTSSGATPWNLTSGPQNALVVLTYYQSDPATPSYGLTEVGQVVDSTASFWAEDSYGKFSLVPTLVDWTPVDIPQTGDIADLYPAVVDEVDDSVDFSQIDMLVIIGDLRNPLYAGQAYRTPITVNTDEGPQSMRVFSIETTTSILQSRTEFIAKHELSHTVGLDHARWLDCGGQPVAASGCTAANLDTTNVLRPSTSTRPAHHLHAAQKFLATYIDETQVTTVTETGTYSIVPLGLPPGPGIRALRMAAPADTPLWIEYRQPIGIDSGMDAAPPGETSTVYDGALITRPWDEFPNQFRGSTLVDADFTQGYPFDGLYFTLRPGETLEDPTSGASITTVSATPSALTVEIEIDCQDGDGDGYGENCLAGDDCDDNDPNITDSGPADVDIPTGEYLVFGDVRIDDVAYQALEIANTGCDTLAILGVNSPDADFTLMNQVVTVPAKSSRWILVRFTPSGLGPDRSDITIQTSDSDEQWITVIAVANAVSPQELDFSPGSFSALVPPGGTTTQVLTIDNLGGNTLNYWIQNQETVPWLDIDSGDALGSIPGFGQKQVALEFNADGQCPATGSVTLRLRSNDDDEPDVFIPVTWEVFAAPDLRFNRDPADVIDFSSPGSSATLRIDNEGCQPLTIQNITSSLSAAFSAPFSGPVTVAPGASYTQGITFVGCPPRNPFANCVAQLTITTDDPDEGVTSFFLTGTGYAP